MMRTAKTFIVGLSAASVVAMVSWAAQADPVKFRLAVVGTKTNWMTQADLHFADVVKRHTKGQVNIEVHFGGTLGNEKEAVQLLRTGALEMTDVSPWKASEFVKEMDIFGVAFAFKGWDHMIGRISDPKLLDMVNDRVKRHNGGFKVLYIGSGGTRNLYNTRGPIETLEQLKGLKMRSTGTPLITSTWNALGTHTTPVSWPELYSALQTGVVQGAENTLSGVRAAKLYERAKYLTRSAHMFDFNSVLISEAAWNKLSGDQQNALMAAAKETQQWVFKTGRAGEDDIANELASKGVQILSGVKDRDSWAARVQPVNAKLAKELGAEDFLAFFQK